MRQIKVLEVNNIDLVGKLFNGYEFIDSLDKKKFDVKQAVVIKQSTNKRVVKIIKNNNEVRLKEIYERLENNLSIHNLFSVTSELLVDMKEYKEADIVHFHMFHNTELSIPSLLKISNEKKVVISLHDSWFLTGRCVHYYDCNKWCNGCINCPNLKSLFSFKDDHCNLMWNIKKETLKNSNITFFVSSKWLEDIAHLSPFIEDKKSIRYVPFGIDLNKYKNYNNSKQLRKKYGINDEAIVLFLRAQSEFKGTEYVVEALKQLNVDKEIVILTCDQRGLLDDLNNNYRIIDLGVLSEKEIINAMNICDIFLMPSKAESFGMMAIEAMACEVPVISFDNTAMTQTIFSPECGIAVKDKNSYELMKAIEMLCLNREERIKRGKMGRKLCERNYSYERYIKNVSSEYEKIYKQDMVNKTKDSGTHSEEYSDEYLKLYKSIKKLMKKKTLNKKDVEIVYKLNCDNINLLNVDLYTEKIKKKKRKKKKDNIVVYYIKKVCFALKYHGIKETIRAIKRNLRKESKHGKS